MKRERRAVRRLAQNIAKRRQECGLNQQDLADLIGADPSTVSKMERAEMAPSVRWLVRLAHALETTVSDLVKGIDDDGVDPEAPADSGDLT